jgi:tetratricopeptide (TPR) repeat protein
VKGIVRDAHQQPVSNVTVTLQPASPSPAQTTRTDIKGLFAFTSLSPGNYVISAQNPALQAARLGPLSLAEHETKTVALTLTSSATSKMPAEFYDEPTFKVAGVSENTGAGVHGSDSAMRNADALSKATASLHKDPVGTASPNTSASDRAQQAHQLQQKIAAHDEPDLHNQLAHLDEGSGRPLEALQEFQRAADMDPSEKNLFDWGTELLVHRAAEPAAEVFSKGNRLYPSSVRMLTGLAVAEYARGAYDAAVNRLCQASDLDPRNPVPYTFLGRMESAEVKRSPNALAKLARFADLYPNDASANFYYAVALWNQPNTQADPESRAQVERLLQKSITLDPKFAVAYLQLGILAASSQNLPAAASAFEKAIALDPNLQEAHYRLAQTYRRMGEDAKAQRELETYQRLMDSADEAAKRDRKIVQQFIYESNTPAPAPSGQPSDH